MKTEWKLCSEQEAAAAVKCQTSLTGDDWNDVVWSYAYELPKAQFVNDFDVPTCVGRKWRLLVEVPEADGWERWEIKGIGGLRMAVSPKNIKTGLDTCIRFGGVFVFANGDKSAFPMLFLSAKTKLHYGAQHANDDGCWDEAVAVEFKVRK